MAKKYVVTLTPADRKTLLQLTQSGKAPARRIKRAQILLKADTVHPEAGWTDEQISIAYDVHPNTIAEIRKRFVLSGLDMGESNAHGADENIRVSDLLAHTKELVWYLAE